MGDRAQNRSHGPWVVSLAGRCPASDPAWSALYGSLARILVSYISPAAGCVRQLHDWPRSPDTSRGRGGPWAIGRATSSFGRPTGSQTVYLVGEALTARLDCRCLR
jgi:hypothetical protein